jgi:hypothetical protein
MRQKKIDFLNLDSMAPPTREWIDLAVQAKTRVIPPNIE